MSNNINYSTELADVVLSLQDNLSKCVSIIHKITEDSHELKKENSKLNNNFKELSEEMANYTKVSFVSNLSKQITKKNDDIDLLQRKIDKLEREINLVNEPKNDKEILLEITTIDNPYGNLKDNSGDNSEEYIIEDNEQTELLNKQETFNKDSDISRIESKLTHHSLSHKEQSREEAEKSGEAEGSCHARSGWLARLREEAEQAGTEAEQSREEAEQSREESEQARVDADQSREEEAEQSREEEEQSRVEEEEEMEFELKKIKKKYYYLSNEVPAGVYTRDADDEVGDKIGEFINNKLVKSS